MEDSHSNQEIDQSFQFTEAFNQNFLNDFPIYNPHNYFEEENNNFFDEPDIFSQKSITKENTNNLTHLLIDNLNNSNLLGKKRGKKRSNKSKSKAHTKYARDNIIRKIKHIMFEQLRQFINSKINSKIIIRKFPKKLLINKKKITFDATKKFNLNLLGKTLGEILSYDVTSRNKVSPKHNKELIEYLMNHENKDIKEYFSHLFNLKFIDCLEHFRGTKQHKYLNGLTIFEQIKDTFENDKEYLKALTNHLMKFEDLK